MRRLTRLLALTALGGCVSMVRVEQQVGRTAATLTAARRVYADRCAPVPLAEAQAHLDFARLELRQGDVPRAAQHADEAYSQAVIALDVATPCGGVDRDRDAVPDLVDACPDVPAGPGGHPDGCPDEGPPLGPGIADAPIAADRLGPDLWAPGDPQPTPDATDPAAPHLGAPDPMVGADPPVLPDGSEPSRASDPPLEAPSPIEAASPALPIAEARLAPHRVRIVDDQLRLDGPIAFEPGSAVLLPASSSLLDEVAVTLVDSPDLHIRVEGHTDSAGSDVDNMALSQERARAVVDHLVQQGVARVRLTSAGLGEGHPIDTNRTESGRAQNRRVEFHIVSDGQ